MGAHPIYIDLCTDNLVKRMQPKLIFVYNADSGVFNLAADIAHKIFSPATYQCSLCAITHAAFGMKKEWRAYIERLDIAHEFLHKNEFRMRFPEIRAALPAVFIQKSSEMYMLIDAATLNAATTIVDIRQLIDVGLEQFRSSANA